MSEKLKPCPFCGGKAITSTFFDWDDLDYMDFEVNDNESIDGDVTCENERCINGWYLSPKDWQTRPIEDALNKRIAELEAESERFTVHSDIERQDDKWIPVSERLPEDGEPVLAAYVDTMLTAAYYRHHIAFGGVDNWWDVEGCHTGNPTHWMPLPPNPESPNRTQTQTQELDEGNNG